MDENKKNLVLEKKKQKKLRVHKPDAKKTMLKVRLDDWDVDKMNYLMDVRNCGISDLMRDLIQEDYDIQKEIDTEDNKTEN